MHRRWILAAGAALFLAGCAGKWEVDYDEGLDPAVTRTWKVTEVIAVAPEDLTVSNVNRMAPNADIVWHGDPPGDRRAQVARILKAGIERGVSDLNGPRPVTISASLRHFHSVTPFAVANAPAAVHNIRYVVRVFDSTTGAPITEAQLISADLEAFVGASAVTAALQGETQKARITRHLGHVTRSWLGIGPDQRRQFSGLGR